MSTNHAILAVQRLAEPHSLLSFDCGIPSLTRFLQKHARMNDAANYCRVYVLCPDAERPSEVKAYYCLSASAVEFENVPERFRLPKGPRYPMPTVLLGRLAVDRMCQQRGYGRFLLLDAMHRALDASERIGARALIVDAINDAARNFYLKYGFIPFLDVSNRLYLPMQTIAQLGSVSSGGVQDESLQDRQPAQTVLNSRSE